MWQVLIVEDDAEMRDFFAASIAASSELAVAGSVATLRAAKELLERPGARFDVVLTDLGLPDGSGLDVIRLARCLHPACDVMVISMFGDEDNVVASIEAGALGYIHKDSSPEDIAVSILQMKAGASPISPMIARRVLSHYVRLNEQKTGAQAAGQGRPLPEADSPALTNREQNALELIARGFSYSEIARLEGISVHTVQSHIKNLYRKLSVNSKNEAVYEATRMGLLCR
ncbi:MAG: DNA-binding response regulator [Ramlibacter sp.]|jgi:DNA-binding NarL/FixJ family response regulator|nr:DNA-binding response regulator [Ramlibacter sp.]MDB5911734.1 DNA-binding response regulator [Ramlibacter sp.]